jgi:hypothetical protein
MAEDIDFKYPMRKACGWEISTFCPKVPHGHARVVRCLQDKLEHEDMSKCVGCVARVCLVKEYVCAVDTALIMVLSTSTCTHPPSNQPIQPTKGSARTRSLVT